MNVGLDYAVANQRDQYRCQIDYVVSLNLRGVSRGGFRRVRFKVV